MIVSYTWWQPEFTELGIHHNVMVMQLHRIIIHMFIISLAYIGVTLYLLLVDWPKSWWSSGSWNRPHVQDRQEQVRVNCKKLDPEICYGLIWFLWGRSILIQVSRPYSLCMKNCWLPLRSLHLRMKWGWICYVCIVQKENATLRTRKCSPIKSLFNML